VVYLKREKVSKCCKANFDFTHNSPNVGYHVCSKCGRECDSIIVKIRYVDGLIRGIQKGV